MLPGRLGSSPGQSARSRGNSVTLRAGGAKVGPAGRAPGARGGWVAQSRRPAPPSQGVCCHLLVAPGQLRCWDAGPGAHGQGLQGLQSLRLPKVTLCAMVSARACRLAVPQLSGIQQGSRHSEPRFLRCKVGLPWGAFATLARAPGESWFNPGCWAPKPPRLGCSPPLRASLSVASVLH